VLLSLARFGGRRRVVLGHLPSPCDSLEVSLSVPPSHTIPAPFFLDSSPPHLVLGSRHAPSICSHVFIVRASPCCTCDRPLLLPLLGASPRRARQPLVVIPPPLENHESFRFFSFFVSADLLARPSVTLTFCTRPFFLSLQRAFAFSFLRLSP